MTPAEILRAAKEKISDPARWCTGELARDANGDSAEPDDPKAVSWCAEGSVCAVTSVAGEVLRANNYLGDAAYDIFGSSAPEANDDLYHADVMAMFDRAIALAEKESGHD